MQYDLPILWIFTFLLRRRQHVSTPYLLRYLSCRRNYELYKFAYTYLLNYFGLQLISCATCCTACCTTCPTSLQQIEVVAFGLDSYVDNDECLYMFQGFFAAFRDRVDSAIQVFCYIYIYMYLLIAVQQQCKFLMPYYIDLCLQCQQSTSYIISGHFIIPVAQSISNFLRSCS